MDIFILIIKTNEEGGKMKKFIIALLILAICLVFCSCGGGALRGTYESESGRYSIDFESNGTCTWYQSGKFFEGTYEKYDSGWRLNIGGDGYYSNTVFYVEIEGNALVVTGGYLDNEIFYKTK